MRPLLWLYFVFPLCAADFTAAANFQISATPRSAIISYLVPAGDANTVCTPEYSESPSYLPLVPDVDPALFSGSNADNRAGSVSRGRYRVFVLGQGGTGIQYAPVALDGRRYSRALQAFTTHYGRVTCGADAATLSFMTANIAAGDSYPAAIPTDPASPGVAAWPTIDWTTKNVCYNNPMTGICTQVFALGSYRNYTAIDEAFHHQYQATGWTTPANILANDGSLAVTGNTNPIVVTTDTVDGGNGTAIGGLTLEIKGFVADACSAGNDRMVSVAAVFDGVSAYGPFIDVTLPTQTAYGAGVETAVGDANPNPAPFMKAWFSPGQAIPFLEFFNPLTGNYTRAGAALTLNYGSTNPFDQNWVSGSHIILDSSGTPTETTLASVTSGTAVTVAAGSGPGTANWTAPNFGFIIKKKTALCTMSIDYVHVIRTHYVNPYLNNGSGSSRQTPYRRYPQGWRVTNCTNASPIVCTTGSTTHTIQVNNVVKIAKVLGNTAANGSFTVSAVTATTFTLQGSTGNGAFSGDGIVYTTTPAAATGYVFQSNNFDNQVEMNWINPDTNPATINYVGLQVAYSAAGVFPGINIILGDIYALDDSDPDAVGFWLTLKPTADPTKAHVFKGTYLGRVNGGLFQDLGPFDPGTTDDYRWVDVTPSPNSLTDQLAAFDAKCTGACLNGGTGSLLNSNTLTIAANLGGQNALSWLGAFDTGTGLVKGLGNSWSAPNARFCGLHTLFTPYGSQAYLYTWYQLLGAAAGGGSNTGPFLMTVTNAGLNTTSLNDCGTLLAGLGLSNPLGVTGNKCSQVTVNSTTPVSTGTPINQTIQAMAVGDLMDVRTPGGADDGEAVRIVGISGTTILVVQRPLWLGASAIAHPSGSLLFAKCTTVPNTMLATNPREPYYNTQVWWDYAADPHMLNTADQYQQQLNAGTVYVDQLTGESSHNAARDNFTAFDGNALPFPAAGRECPSDPLGRPQWVRYGDFRSNIAQCHQYNPAFDGSAGGGFGNNVETHPSAGAITGTQANTHIIDSRPHQVEHTWQQTVAKVGGRNFIYKVTGYNDFGNTYDYKRQGLTVMSGRSPVRDVSAAGFDYAAHDDASYAYTFCHVYVTNDCLTGSAANDVYLNIPKAAQAPTGFPFGTGYRCLGQLLADIDDICVAIAPVHGNNVVQYSMDATHHDGFGLGARRIGIPFISPKNLDGSNENGNELPDGSAEAIEAWLTPVHSLFLLKLPPYPGPSTINRTSWIPVPLKVTSVPAGTNSAYIEFGYNPNFFCSARQEICVANTSAVQAFSYETSDAPAGLACASGCTITIPALSQRVMWYRWVFRNAGNATIATTPTVPITTP